MEISATLRRDRNRRDLAVTRRSVREITPARHETAPVRVRDSRDNATRHEARSKEREDPRRRSRSRSTYVPRDEVKGHSREREREKDCRSRQCRLGETRSSSLLKGGGGEGGEAGRRDGRTEERRGCGPRLNRRIVRRRFQVADAAGIEEGANGDHVLISLSLTRLAIVTGGVAVARAREVISQGRMVPVRRPRNY